MLAANLLPGCGGGTGGEGGEKTEIMLGALNSATGANVAAGAEQRWAYEQAVKDINEAGGVNVGGKKMTLRLVFEDDQSTADGGAAAMEKLVKVDKVDLCLWHQRRDGQRGGCCRGGRVQHVLRHQQQPGRRH